MKTKNIEKLIDEIQALNRAIGNESWGDNLARLETIKRTASAARREVNALKGSAKE